MHGPQQYRSRPMEIEAMLFTGSNQAEVRAWMDQRASQQGLSRNDPSGPWSLWVEKSLAWCEIEPGSYIIKEPDGSGFYPCAGDIFQTRWEAVAG